MKNKLFIGLIGLFIILFSSFALSATVPTGGYSYYNFSDVTDLWGTRNATNHGATVSYDYPVFNISGNSSPSSYNYVTTTYTDLPFQPLANDFTYTYWIKRSNAPTREVLISGINSGGWEFTLEGNSDGQVQLSYSTNGLLVGNAVVDNGSWNMITFVVNSSNYGTIYINGNYDNSVQFTSDFSKNINMKMGLRSDGDTQFPYYGLIDEVKIFNKTLNQTEISNLYNYGTIDIEEASITSPIDILFKNETGSYKTEFGEGEDFLVDINYTLSNGTNITNSTDHVFTLYSVLDEIDTALVPFYFM